MRPTTSQLIADPFRSLEESERFHLRDVAQLPSMRLWAERKMIEADLARRIAQQVRPRIILAWPSIVTDEEWLTARLRALYAEQTRRGPRAA
jgi:hypothetical protein